MKLGGFSLALVAGGVLALVVGASQQTTAGATPDVDSDLVFNVKDNCINKENALNAQGVQADSDRDGFGNQCDGDFTGPVVISGVPVPASDCATVSPTSDPGGGCAGCLAAQRRQSH